MPRRIVSLDARRDRVARHRTGQNKDAQFAGPALRRCRQLLHSAEPTRRARVAGNGRPSGRLFRPSVSLPAA